MVSASSAVDMVNVCLEIICCGSSDLIDARM